MGRGPEPILRPPYLLQPSSFILALLVDWAGSAFKTGVHEVSSEIKLINPATLHLSMPKSVRALPEVELVTWKQEQLIAGGLA